MIETHPWPGVHTAIDEHFENLVDQIAAMFREDVERSLEQSPLGSGADIRNNNDQAVMQIELRVTSEEIATIVGHENVILGKCKRHQVPILPSAFADMANMIGLVTARFGRRY